MRGLGRLRRWGTRLGPLPLAIILAYHRVADLGAYLQLICRHNSYALPNYPRTSAATEREDRLAMDRGIHTTP